MTKRILVVLVLALAIAACRSVPHAYCFNEPVVRNGVVHNRVSCVSPGSPGTGR